MMVAATARYTTLSQNSNHYQCSTLGWPSHITLNAPLSIVVYVCIHHLFVLALQAGEFKEYTPVLQPYLASDSFFSHCWAGLIASLL